MFSSLILSLPFPPFFYGFTSEQHRDLGDIRRIHISDIFIDARPKGGSARGLSLSFSFDRSGDWVERELNRISFWTQMNDTIKFARARLRKFARAFNAFANWRARPIWMLRRIQTATCFQSSKSGASIMRDIFENHVPIVTIYPVYINWVNCAKSVFFLRTRLIYLFIYCC